ncbi:hypothetical protein T439DRAFT_304877 [Meredithblackwellia eburnea MCA 4105]
MTSKSATSSLTTIPREDSDVYQFTLRTAILADEISSTGLGTNGTGTGTGTGTVLAPPTLRHASSFQPTNTNTNTSTTTTTSWSRSILSLSTSSLTTLPPNTNSTTVKFPKDFLKLFISNLSTISTLSQTNSLLKQSLKHFINKYNNDPSFQRNLKQNRQIEELILTFGTTAATTLRSTTSAENNPSAWKQDLDAHIAHFLRFVRDTLASKELSQKVPSELWKRLDDYALKIGIPPHSTSTSPSPQASSSTPSDDAPPGPSQTTSLATNLAAMPLTLTVGKLFGKLEHELMKDVVALRRRCTEKAAYTDLKAIINSLARSSPSTISTTTTTSTTTTPAHPKFHYVPSDFLHESCFQKWRRKESASLSDLLVSMIKRDPSLPVAVASDRLTTTTGVGPTPTTDTDEDSMDLFFVPPDPLFYYRRLYEISLDHSYTLLSSLPPSAPVPLTILSSECESLLREIEKRWRVSEWTRRTTFVRCLVGFVRELGVPGACVEMALRECEAVGRESGDGEGTGDVDWDEWPIVERTYLSKNLRSLFNLLLPRFFEIFEGILLLPYSEILPSLTLIHSCPLLSLSLPSGELSTTFDELREGMRKFVKFAYEDKMAEMEMRERGNDLQPFLTMLVWVREETKGLQKVFGTTGLLGEIDPPALFIGIAAPEFVHHLSASQQALVAAANQKEGAAGDDDLLALYRGVVQLEEMHDAFVPETPLVIDFSAWFEPYVRRWLATTDARTMEWVKRAIGADKFVPEEESDEKQSTSVVDLIASCQSATDWVLKLDWPNEVENARYLTSLSQTIAKSIQQYTSLLETMFIDEMFPKKEEHSHSNRNSMDVEHRPSAWLTKAKLAVQGDQKVEPFVFKPTSLVKLNNIQAARSLLDRMYTKLDAERVSTILAPYEAPPPPPTQSRYLFTVKVVLGENLVPTGRKSGGTLDPFLILSDPAGHRVAKTRTLYETNDPRWDETFDVSVKGDLWLRATVYNRNLMDEHDIVARAFIHLNPPEFGDYLPRDVWLRLESVSEQRLDSRLLLRISMEGEKDDIRFYFGRAFRFLKRAEGDMTRMIVDKMSPFIRHYLSQSTLKALVKTQFNFEIPDIDLSRVQGNITKATGKINAYVRGALAQDENALLIPSVEEYRQGQQGASVAATQQESMIKRKVKGPLTDQEVEDAIGPLLDYFNDTFRVLNETLSAEAWGLVSTKLWKEILLNIEGLVLPPLSDQPTEMRPLTEKEIDIVYKWRQFLLDFFHQRGEGLPMSTLRNQKYEDLGMARMYYDWTADALCEEAVRAMQRQLERKESGASGLGRTKSVLNQRNLGTIKARKKEKAAAESSNVEVILRLLRMHPGQGDFLQMQINQLNIQAQQVSRAGAGSIQRRHANGHSAGGAGGRRLSGLRGRGGRNGPAVPNLPTIPDQYR